jgi:hypothetical protein
MTTRRIAVACTAVCIVAPSTAVAQTVRSVDREAASAWVSQFAEATIGGSEFSHPGISFLRVGLYTIGPRGESRPLQWRFDGTVMAACSQDKVENVFDRTASGREGGEAAGGSEVQSFAIDPNDAWANAVITGTAYSTSCQEDRRYVFETTFSTPSSASLYHECALCVRTERYSSDTAPMYARQTFTWCEPGELGTDDEPCTGGSAYYDAPREIRIGKEIRVNG